MKGATLRQRPFCGAAPRRFLAAPLRPGIRVSVIVPSKDNASGSSDKRLPLLWNLSDPQPSQQEVVNPKDYLEAVFNSQDALEPDFPTPAASHQQQQQPLDPQNADYHPLPQWPHETLSAANTGTDSPDWSSLQERIASASAASTSAPSCSASSAQSQHSHEHRHPPQQLHQRSVRTGASAALSANGVVGRVSAATVVVERERLETDGSLSSVVEGAASSLCGSGAGASFGGSSSGDQGGSHSSRSVATAAYIDQQSESTSLSSPWSSSSSDRHLDGHNGHLNGHNGYATGHLNGHNGHLNGLNSHNGHGHGHPNSHHESRTTHPTDAALERASAVVVLPEPHQLPLALNSLLAPPEGTQAAQQRLREDEEQEALLRQQQQHQAVGSNGGLASEGTHGSGVATPATAQAAAPAADTSIPQSIWILCCISAALTCASCVFNTALPIYMVSELKMSMRSMGMFEGLLEAFSYVVRMCSGVVSDRMTSRKAAITLGFAAGAMAKFGMASAGTVGLLFAGKAVDRLANGIQAAPRDALIGDLSPQGVRSACFGLAQSLRKWGSAVGALSAFFLMKASNNNYQLIFYSAATVSLTACLAFVLFVPAHTRTPPHIQQREAQAAQAQKQHGQAGTDAAAAKATAAAATAAAPAPTAGPFAGAREFIRSLGAMGSDFYRMLGVICCYALGHVNESLLEARAMEVGFGKAEATLVVAALAAVTFLTAFPLGQLDDKYGAGMTFAVGIGSLIAGDLVLLLSGPHPLALFAACLFLGVHWAVIQGPLLSIVSGLAPAHLRGTAFGIFYTVMAVTAVAANTMYGSIWHTYGANAAFITSAALMSVVLAALPHMLPPSARQKMPVAAAVPPPAPLSGGSVSLVASPLPAAA